MTKQITTCIVLINLCVLSPSLLRINSAEGQDIHFSQFSASPLMLNPAAAGNFKGRQRAVINYKDQWRSIANPYTTYALALDMPVFKQQLTKGSMGVGLTAFRDKAGDMEMGTAQVNLMVSYRALLNDNNSLSAGIQGGFAQRSINGSTLQWGNQDDGVSGYDPGLSSGETSELNNFSYGDFSGGIMWNYQSDKKNLVSNDGFSADLGAAFFHINQPKGAFYTGSEEKLYTKLVMHGLASIGLKSTNTAIQPGILLLQQGSLSELLIGTMIRYQIKEDSKHTDFKRGPAVSIGGHYRVGAAFIPTFLFEYAGFALGFSYDINVSGLVVAGSRGGGEISLSYISNPFNRSSRSRPSNN